MTCGQKGALIAAGHSLKVRFNTNNEVAPALPVIAELAAAEGVRGVQMIAAKAVSAFGVSGIASRVIAVEPLGS